MTSPTAPDDAVSLREVVAVVLRYWWLAGGILLASLALAGFYLTTQPSLFEGRATIQLAATPESGGWPPRTTATELLRSYSSEQPRLVEIDTRNGRWHLVVRGADRAAVAQRLQAVVDKALALERQLFDRTQALAELRRKRLEQSQQRLERLDKALEQSSEPLALGTMMEAENSMVAQLAFLYRHQAELDWSEHGTSVLEEPTVQPHRPGPDTRLIIGLALAVGGILAVVGAVIAENLRSFLRARRAG